MGSRGSGEALAPQQNLLDKTVADAKSWLERGAAKRPLCNCEPVAFTAAESYNFICNN
jgi:hypothetical protein